jgi:hypothetical protein
LREESPLHRIRCLALEAGFRALRFHRPPPLAPDPARDAAFDALLENAVARGPVAEIEYRLTYPKHEFLTYLVETKDVLLHGSNDPDIRRLEPSITTTWDGHPVQAVFAASDGLWPLFFAIVNHGNGPYTLRNGCYALPEGNGCYRKFYFFSIDRDAAARDPWTDGWVYLLPRRTFRRVSPSGLMRDEWISLEPVVPLARLAVTREDFPFFGRIVAFRRGEPMPVTWLRGAVRLR